MTETKSIFSSRTVWGAVVAILAALAGLAGYTVDQAAQDAATGLVDEILAIWDRLAVVAGGALAIWGRIAATKALR